MRYHTSAGSVLADDAKLLFEEIRRSGGISIPHTSATGMGTDWRDNDPEVEPLVEIYQGDRHNYEAAGAPLSDSQRGDRCAQGRLRFKGVGKRISSRCGGQLRSPLDPHILRDGME